MYTHTHTRTPPVSASNISDEEEEDKTTEPVIIKPLSILSQPADDAELVEPKRLHNPHLESKLHRQLNKEIKFNSARCVCVCVCVCVCERERERVRAANFQLVKMVKCSCVMHAVI